MPILQGSTRWSTVSDQYPLICPLLTVSTITIVPEGNWPSTPSRRRILGTDNRSPNHSRCVICITHHAIYNKLDHIARADRLLHSALSKSHCGGVALILLKRTPFRARPKEAYHELNLLIVNGLGNAHDVRTPVRGMPLFLCSCNYNA